MMIVTLFFKAAKFISNEAIYLKETVAVQNEEKQEVVDDDDDDDYI